MMIRETGPPKLGRKEILLEFISSGSVRNSFAQNLMCAVPKNI